jgi:hypothetical protein
MTPGAQEEESKRVDHRYTFRSWPGPQGAPHLPHSADFPWRENRLLQKTARVSWLCWLHLLKISWSTILARLPSYVYVHVSTDGEFVRSFTVARMAITEGDVRTSGSYGASYTLLCCEFDSHRELVMKTLFGAPKKRISRPNLKIAVWFSCFELMAGVSWSKQLMP